MSCLHCLSQNSLIQCLRHKHRNRLRKPTPAAAAGKRKSIGLLDLPPEIRLIIYEELLTTSIQIRVDIQYPSHYHFVDTVRQICPDGPEKDQALVRPEPVDSLSLKLCPQILLLNRQINAEAQGLVAKNHFVIPVLENADSFAPVHGFISWPFHM